MNWNCPYYLAAAAFNITSASFQTNNICPPQVEHFMEPRVYNRGGTSLQAYVTTLHGVHDLCNDIHMLEALVLAVCGHIAKPQVQ